MQDANMAPDRLHLLTLPREVRDCIYSHLFQAGQFRTLAIKRKESQDLRIDVRIDNSPLLNVLLVHSRIRDEYSEAACFKEPSISIVSGRSHLSPSLPYKDVSADERKLAKAAVIRAKHVSVYHDDTPMHDRVDFLFEEAVRLVSYDLATPLSVRIVTRSRIGTVHFDASTCTPGELPNKPDVMLDGALLGHPLAQQGSCLSLSNRSYWWAPVRGCHRAVDLVTFGVYTSGRVDELLWDEDVVRNAPWRINRYSEAGLKPMSEEQLEKMRDLPKVAFDWSAQRVDMPE